MCDEHLDRRVDEDMYYDELMKRVATSRRKAPSKWRLPTSATRMVTINNTVVRFLWIQSKSV